MNKSNYSLTLEELISRPVLRSDNACEFLNKMTNEEIRQFEIEVDANLIEEGIPQTFPEWNVAFLVKTIDRSILYELIKLGHKLNNKI